MGRRPNWPPKLVRKPNTAEARTYHAGRWWTCGAWDAARNEATPQAKARHALLIARWLADPGSAVRPKGEYLLAEVLADFGASADGPKTAHARRMLARATELLDPWLASAADAFGPAELVAWQAGLGEADYAQMTVYHLRLQLLRAYQFAEDTGRVPVGHAARLWAAVARRATPGRPMARRRPAVEADVAATAAALRPTQPVVAALVELHALVGARVYELLKLTRADVRTGGVLRTARGAVLDLTAEGVWAADLGEHKTAHLGKDRVLVFGPKARRVLAQAVAGKKDGDLLFPLAAAWADTSYHQFVRNACRRVGVPHWTPRQLRQMVADRVRDALTAEHAAAYLGHGPKGTTERHYLTLALKKAAEAARAVG